MLPQLIFLFLLALGLGISLSRHGQERTERSNFLHSLIGSAITLALVWWGGFFAPLGL